MGGLHHSRQRHKEVTSGSQGADYRKVMGRQRILWPQIKFDEILRDGGMAGDRPMLSKLTKDRCQKLSVITY